MSDEGFRVTIREEDIVGSIADALQYIAVYHPPSFVKALAEAYGREESPAAKNAIGQILMNSRLSAFGRRPICQDTGTVNAFVKIGMGARIATSRSLQELVDEGVRRAYTHPDNPLRASIVSDPLGAAPQHRRQHAGRRPCRDGGGRRRDRHGGGQGRRLGKQVPVH